MGMGYVPQDPLCPQSPGAHVQGRQYRGTPPSRDLEDRTAVGPDRSRIQRGRWGEDQAERWYRHHGYQILDRNWRIAGGEIDLVLGREALVVFSEVKTRANDSFGVPALAVTFAKQRRIRKLAVAWLTAHECRADELRFDVVSVLGVRVEVIEGAF